MRLGTFALAGAGVAPIDYVRRSFDRANMMSLLELSAREFGGGFGGALNGARDDQSILVRQAAIYLAHTTLGMRKADCVKALGLSKWVATRALHAIETRRSNAEFNSRIERLEQVLTRLVVDARHEVRPVPPTQGLSGRPVSAFAEPADFRRTAGVRS